MKYHTKLPLLIGVMALFQSVSSVAETQRYFIDQYGRRVIISDQYQNHGGYVTQQSNRGTATPKQYTIPESFKKTEALKAIYTEFIKASASPNASALYPDDTNGIKCHIYSAKTGKLEEYQVYFTTWPYGNNRFLKMELKSEKGSLVSNNFLMVKNDHNWRAQSELPVSSEAIAGNFYLSGFTKQRADRREIEVKGAVNKFDTIALTQNNSDPEELFLELGIKSEIAFWDSEKNPIAFDLANNSPTLYSPYIQVGKLAEYFRRLLLEYNGNLTAAQSVGFADENTRLDLLHRTHAIGICRKSDAPPPVANNSKK